MSVPTIIITFTQVLMFELRTLNSLDNLIYLSENYGKMKKRSETD